MIKIVLASAALLVAGSAQAVTVTSGAYYTPRPSDKIIDNFDAAAPGVAFTGSYSIQPGSTGNAAAPAGDTTAYFTTPGVTLPTPGTATIDFSGSLAANRKYSSVSFYWGSIDTYNTLTLLGTGLTGPTVFTGSQISMMADGNRDLGVTNRTVTFKVGEGEKLTGFQLDSTNRAFEIDTITGSVPEPATWAMLVVGFAMVGGAVRLRTRALAA